MQLYNPFYKHNTFKHIQASSASLLKIKNIKKLEWSCWQINKTEWSCWQINKTMKQNNRINK